MTVALQHVVVRMLYDARFCESVFESPDRALADVELSPQDVAWLLQTDTRAFRTDPHRRARSLTGLLEEYPTSAAELVRLARRDPAVSVLDNFFSSDEFHRGMQDGDSLAVSFGQFLVRTAGEFTMMAHSLATLELAIARLRRLRLVDRSIASSSPECGSPGGHGASVAGWTELSPRDASSIAKLRTAPTYAWVYVHPEALNRFGSIRQKIALQNVDARAAIVDLSFDLGDSSIELNGELGPVLLSATLGPAPARGGWMRVIDVEISPISAELASVLTASRSGIEIPTLLDQVRSLGAEDSESLDILNDLVRDGILIEDV